MQNAEVLKHATESFYKQCVEKVKAKKNVNDDKGLVNQYFISLKL